MPFYIRNIANNYLLSLISYVTVILFIHYPIIS